MQLLRATGLRWTWITLLVLVLDRISKMLVLKHFGLYEMMPLTSFFNLTLAYNRGAAFSFLNSASGWQAWLFGILAVSISAILLNWLRKISAKDIWLAVALSAIIGGALGNLWDRLSYGYVIDFIDVHWGVWHWPVFNIADSAICIGAFMLFGEALIHKKK